MSGKPFTLLVDIPLKPGRADEFMALFNEVFEAMKVEETFISATALRGAEDGAAFWGIRELYAKDRFTIDLGWCAASRASFPRIGRKTLRFSRSGASHDHQAMPPTGTLSSRCTPKLSHHADRS